MARRRLKGIIISDKMDKTLVVRVERWKKHPHYLRRYKTHASYKVHDPLNEYKEGMNVVIEETRPLSKDKRWQVVNAKEKKATEHLS